MWNYLRLSMWRFITEMWQQQQPAESDGFHASPIRTIQITRSPVRFTYGLILLKSDQNEVSNTCPSMSAAISPLDAPPLVNMAASLARVECQLPSAQLEPDSGPPAQYLSSNLSVFTQPLAHPHG